MHYKRSKRSGGALYECFPPFYQVEHIDKAVGIMQNRFGKPVPPGFYKFRFVRAGTLFGPAVSFGYLSTRFSRFSLVQEVVRFH